MAAIVKRRKRAGICNGDFVLGVDVQPATLQIVWNPLLPNTLFTYADT